MHTVQTQSPAIFHTRQLPRHHSVKIQTPPSSLLFSFPHLLVRFGSGISESHSISHTNLTFSSSRCQQSAPWQQSQTSNPLPSRLMPTPHQQCGPKLLSRNTSWNTSPSTASSVSSGYRQAPAGPLLYTLGTPSSIPRPRLTKLGRAGKSRQVTHTSKSNASTPTTPAPKPRPASLN